MRSIKKSQTKIFVLLSLVLALAISLFVGLSLSRPTAFAEGETQGEVEEKDYSTNVEKIIVKVVPGAVFFGFELSNHDYTERFGSDYQGNSSYDKYITELTYWKDFSSMNSAGAKLTQIFVYWNGGIGNDDLGGAFANTIAHRSDLTALEYGFVITIPKGTTFPSYRYVKDEVWRNSEEPAVYYTTTEDRAFYYDGSAFVMLPYEVAGERESLSAELDSIDRSVYYEEEVAEVEKLIENAKYQINISFSVFSIQEVKSNFYVDLDKIMTKNDYVELADKKAQAKVEISNYFNALLQDDYDEFEWNKILAIVAESSGVIDDPSLKSIATVDEVVVGVKFAIDVLLTTDEKADFAVYRTDKSTQIANAFNPSLYLQEEIALGNALVAEGASRIENATTYSEVDALFGEYLARLDGLKTKAEYEEESRENESESEIESESESIIEEAPQNLTWIFIAIGGGVVLLAVVAVVIIIIIKKKRGVQDEE